MRKITIFVIIAMILSVSAKAQDPKIEIGAYVDTYIATDNTNGGDSLALNRPFSYVNPKKGQFSINTAQITAKVKIDNLIRSNFTLHVGDLHKTAWVSMGTQMPLIQQANVGFRLFGNFWVDGGYFLTHIGGESLLPKDNWLSSHSLVTYFEPFYQAGIKASYETEKVTAQIHLLNGNGIFDDNNNNKTLGLFFSFTPSTLLSVSYAGVIGNEEPGAPYNAKTHQLHNFVAQVNPFTDFSVKGQFDIDMKEVQDPNNGAEMISGNFKGLSLTAHYQFIKHLGGTFRFAYIDNANGVYAPIVKGTEITLGCEFKPSDNSFIRLEGRNISLDDKYKLFVRDGKSDKSRMEVILNMGIWLN